MAVRIEKQRRIHFPCNGLGFFVKGGKHDDLPDVEFLLSGELFLFLFGGRCHGVAAGIDGKAYIAGAGNLPVHFAHFLLFFSEIDDGSNGKTLKVADVLIRGIGEVGGPKEPAALDNPAVQHRITAQVPCVHNSFYRKKLLGENACGNQEGHH